MERSSEHGAMAVAGPSKRRWRMMAVFSIVAGVALIAFEWINRAKSGAERWFWVSIAAMLVIFGILDLVLAPTDATRARREKLPLEP